MVTYGDVLKEAIKELDVHAVLAKDETGVLKQVELTDSYTGQPTRVAITGKDGKDYFFRFEKCRLVPY